MKLPDVLVIYNNSNPIKRIAYGDIEKIYKRLRLERPLLILLSFIVQVFKRSLFPVVLQPLVARHSQAVVVYCPLGLKRV